MFAESKTLIVISKDEMAINQLKKLVESDKEKFPNVKVVAWNEKVWNANKKSGNIDSKVLFLGEVKGIDKLIPVLDEKYNHNGVKFGWAGKQAVVYSDNKELAEQSKYDEFFDELEKMPVPDMLKKRVTSSKELVEDTDEAENVVVEVRLEEDAEDSDMDENDKNVKKTPIGILKAFGEKIKEGADFVGDVATKASSEVTSIAQDVFKDRALIKRQMLFFGVIKMCEEGLDEFVNS
ncbi:MAG: hypothetical protein MJZ11_02935 [Lachnospiraceae bacterium]|nr:hypothetical protein [Lachnospiraceae bacterium]